MKENIAISLEHITKAFQEGANKEFIAVHDINLEIEKGEIFELVGPSGSGKSTLLRIMSGLDKKFSGSIKMAPDISSSDISFVFQEFALLPWLTVRENIELGLLGRGMPKDRRRLIADKEIKRLRLESFHNSYPRELSGGMKQRVGIARAFVTDPKIIFMDEPFSELDSFTAEELRKELLAIWADRKPTIIMVTHIVEEAVELGDTIAALTSTPGKIEKIVKNTLPRPREKRSSDFFALEDVIYKLIRP